jgi:hypothetical protein
MQRLAAEALVLQCIPIAEDGFADNPAQSRASNGCVKMTHIVPDGAQKPAPATPHRDALRF